ncbi:GreA/GreB family elongation factor [Lacinutrix iliipiscaria]|uniref:Transcription elongation factor GreB n=2 Tax=Flavobacteriaceae TaxID=49546 RepID=A0A420DKU8_9FLAO|nr:GreA/GreB family elongation factor [Ichthyenterobacterium magnum]RKE94839.1 transcription elongation factor GreB [Ichthyenterobacterium magnum]
MSRGFVKEDDQEEIPIVPPRAHLPEGVTNYVTPMGMDELLTEKQVLLDEKNELSIKDENERRIALNHIDAKLNLLNSRISSAKVVDLKTHPPHEIRFGASVTLKKESTKQIEKYQIVGVDEADISKGKISFISPLAKMLIHKKVGDRAILELPQKQRVYDVLEIEY